MKSQVLKRFLIRKELDEANKLVEYYSSRMTDLAAENKRLREALNKISALPPLVPDVDPFIQTCHNYGVAIEKARAALGGEE